jgi:ribonuclease P protein component
MVEADLPTEHSQTRQETRIPRPHADPSRPGGAQGTPPQGPRSPVGLIWRVRDRATFLAFRRARRSDAGLVSVRYVPGPPAQPPRVAYAVTRRAGTAVTRNRIRRQLRAATASHAGQLQSGGAYLITAGPGAATASFARLSGDLATALEAFGA